MSIHAIIWDVGGVLVRTEDWAPRDNLANRLGLTRQELNDLVFGTPENAAAQLGEITHEEHWDKFRKTLQISVEEVKQLEQEFFAGDKLDVDLVDFIRALKKNYHIVLLSNALSNLRIAITNEWKIDDAFHQIIISAEVGMMKPDEAIYELTLERMGFEPYETVFIDDFPRNIEGARQVGMHTILFKDTNQVMTELNTLLADGSVELP